MVTSYLRAGRREPSARATMQREVTEPALSRQLPEKVGGVEPADLFRIQAAVGKEPSCTLSNTEIGPL
jgi:hypothetical protein